MAKANESDKGRRLTKAESDELLMEVKNLLEDLSRALSATERIFNTIREEPHANGKKASEDTDPAKRSEEDGRPGGVVPPMI